MATFNHKVEIYINLESLDLDEDGQKFLSEMTCFELQQEDSMEVLATFQLDLGEVANQIKPPSTYLDTIIVNSV